MNFYCKTTLIVGLFVLFTSTSLAAIENADSLALLQKIEQLSKKNKELKHRITAEIRKQDVILSRILKLTSNVELKAENQTKLNAEDSLSMADFDYVDDNLLRKCKSVTRDLYNKKNLEQRQFNKNTYETEEYDADWTSEVNSGIYQHLSSRFPGTEIVTIECRTSICEINLKHENDTARDDFNYNFDPNNQWNIIDTQNEDDVITNGSSVVIQIAR